MYRTIAGSMAALALSLAVASAPARAADPSIDQIYQAVEAGQLDKAQQMMDQVLKDHPDSAKAHYVQAELYARERQVNLAREELSKAEQLKPGLPDINPRSVAELKSEIGLAPRAAEHPYALRTAPPAGTGTHFPWGSIFILVVVALVFWAIFRRRTAYASYPGAPMGGPGPGYGPGGYGPGGYVGPGGGGIGSSVAGGLAGGLAAGAGIVAGEELAHHFLDGGQPGSSVVPPANAGEWNDPAGNADAGGHDFGVNDPGSWDDGGGGGGGDFGAGDGGGDWT